MPKRYKITLTPEERLSLEQMVRSGKAPARTLTRARVLLKADCGGGRGPPGRAGLYQAASGPRPLDGAAADRPPRRVGDGRGGLARDRPPRAQKNELKPWLVKQWCIPPQANAAFVAAMEDVLEVYTRPYDPLRPQVCMDEKAVQLIGETRQPLPAKAGHEARCDFEYERRGVTNLFMFFEPLAGRREVEVRAKRGARQWAEVIRELVDVHYPKAERIVLVLDNLNTHALSSLYEVFKPEEARRIARKLELHYTPKHGSWLNMAEIEISALARQCLRRRLASEDVLGREVAAWAEARNNSGATVDWRFTTDDARIKLKRLYPSL